MKKWLFILPAMLLVSCGGTNVSSSTDAASSDESSSVEDDTYKLDIKLNISILGDSISTYEGYSNDGEVNSIGDNAVFFPNRQYTGANMTVEETWWMRAISKLGAELCCNNSYSGSCVMDENTYDFRTQHLTNLKANTTPDVIIVYMGINDFAANNPLGDYTGSSAEELPESASDFSTAYGKTIENIKKHNENATVFCCTPTLDRKRSTTTANSAGQEESEYFSRIKTIAENTGCQTIDLYSDSGINETTIRQYTIDKLHPNSKGMEKIASLVAKTVSEYYTK